MQATVSFIFRLTLWFVKLWRDEKEKMDVIDHETAEMMILPSTSSFPLPNVVQSSEKRVVKSKKFAKIPEPPSTSAPSHFQAGHFHIFIIIRSIRSILRIFRLFHQMISYRTWSTFTSNSKYFRISPFTFEYTSSIGTHIFSLSLHIWFGSQA